MVDYFEPIVYVLLLVVPLLAMVWWKGRLQPREYASHEQQREQYGEKMRQLYGEPEESLWTMEMPVLIYDRFVVVDGVQAGYDDIRDITYNSAAWEGSRCYQVILRTTLPGHEFLYIQVGDDKDAAIDMMEYIDQRRRS